jgi:hypothetical protein
MAQIQIRGSEQYLKPPPDQHLIWKREFDELGPEGVRSALITARWDKKKRSAASQWLDRSDAINWKNTRPERGAVMWRLHSAKWWGYAAAFLTAAMIVGRLLRRW